MQKNLPGYIFLLQLVLIGLIIPSCSAQQDRAVNALSAKEAATLIENRRGDPEFVILDIRTPGEYQSGHIKNAVMIDYYSKSFVNNIGRLDREKTYLVYCRSGNRSTRSMDLFKKLQFQKIYHLSSGINSWYAAGLPVEK